ncbi:MAG: aminoacyl-tRNA hydrolase [Parcubacteria group bacterium]|nr:aminoacyl-tRNA hydrolase [Parcubacteria group bacterium]
MSKFLIIGLGNTGEKYEKTYHNVGSLAIDHLAQKLSLTPKILKIPIRWNFRKITSTIFSSEELILAKPSCYMNESGTVVAPLLKHYSVPPDHLVVVHDDSDIILGNFKLKFGGSSGGHRGIESIIQTTGTQDFWHLKIGIRPEESESPIRLKAERLVLQHIGEEKQTILDQAIDNALDSLLQELKTQNSKPKTTT